MDDATQTKRNLDGIYFRVQRDGKWGNTCFSDLTQEEMERTEYYYLMRDFDGSTGFYLYDGLKEKDKKRLVQYATHILRQYKGGGTNGKKKF